LFLVGKKVNEDEIDTMIEEGDLNAFNEDVNLQKHFNRNINYTYVILETKRLKLTLKDVEERHNEFVHNERKIRIFNRGEHKGMTY
jgi:hypothetical protein